MVYLISGIVFGLSAGLAPGPLITLVLTETFRHGYKAGIKVAFAPIITDLPIVVLTLLVISKLSSSNLALGLISLSGAFFVVYLGFETFTSPEITTSSADREPQSLRKGILTNMLSPHPYLFWMTVGAPMVMQASSRGAVHVSAFVIGFYFFLIGSKIAVSILAGRARHLIIGRAYRHCMRGLGVLLWVFAFVLARDAVRLFMQ